MPYFLRQSKRSRLSSDSEKSAPMVNDLAGTVDWLQLAGRRPMRPAEAP